MSTTNIILGTFAMSLWILPVIRWLWPSITSWWNTRGRKKALQEKAARERQKEADQLAKAAKLTTPKVERKKA